MSDESRRKRLMQENMDAESALTDEYLKRQKERPRSRLQLEPDDEPETARYQLDMKETAAHEAVQEAVERILRNPVFEVAPKSLAAKIMARLAKTLKADQMMLPEETRLALQIELTMVSLVTLPLMIVAGYLRVMAEEDQSVQQSTAEIIHTLLLMVDSLTVLLDKLEYLAEHDPASAKLLVALVPSVLENLAQAIAPDDWVDQPLEDHEWVEMQEYADSL